MIEVIISISPSLLFLLCLQLLDSYKLVRLKIVCLLLVYGSVAAGFSYLINTQLMNIASIKVNQYSRFVAPFVEEFLKAFFIVFFFVKKRIAFLVEAAIFGFSVGAGFAILENIYYLSNLGEANLVIWILRGFGTSIMHGCTTAIFAMLLKYFSEKFSKTNFTVIISSMLLPILIHGLFNNFIVSPIAFTVIQLTFTPLLFYFVFIKSENQIKNWLELSLESNHKLLAAINEGKLLESKVGVYLQNLKNKFSSLVLADFLCYLRLYVELSMLAKGLLIMKEVGISKLMITNLREKINEIEFLEKNIGFTGKVAVQPIIYNEKGINWIKQVLKESN